MRLSSSKLLSNVAGAYVNYFRSIPLLLDNHLVLPGGTIRAALDYR
ncbi:polar amino acid ABC transporter inner membrane subunit [Pseudomonas putida S11]|nr:polar amino acid ABC transporter inner membrane subunit [Pseudomonas putida S11]